MRDNIFKKIVSFALIAIMTLSLCSPGIVTSYATQDTDATDSSEQTEKNSEETEKNENSSSETVDDVEYTVTLDDGAGGGTLAFTDTDATEKKAKEGETIEVKLTPNEGFKVQALCLADPVTYEVLSKAETENDRFSFKMPARDILVASGFIPIDEETDTSDSETASTESDADDDDYVYDGEQFTLEPRLTDEEAEQYIQDYQEFIEESLKNGDVADSNGVSVQSADGIATYAGTKTGNLDYTFWVIPKGAAFGNIWEDGRDLDHIGIITLKEGSTYHIGYCLHHKLDLQGGHDYTDVTTYLTDSEKTKLTGRALYYGLKTFDKVKGTTWNPDWALNNGSVYPTEDNMAQYVATQVMVWIIEKGWYTYSNNSFALTSKGTSAANTICTKQTSRANQTTSTLTTNAFNTLLNKMKNYDKIPSFSYRSTSDSNTSSNTKLLGYNSSTKKYEITLTDSNSMLSSVSSISGLPSGASYTVDGNKLKITSSSAFSATTITLNKTSFDGSKAVLVWSDKNKGSDGKTEVYQQIGTYSAPGSTPLKSYVRIAANTVSVRAVKVWDDNDDALGVRPASLTVTLKKGSAKGSETTTVGTYELNAKNSWTVNVTDLPQKSSNGTTVSHIYYTFTEPTITNYSGSGPVESKDGSVFVYTFTNKPTIGHGNVQKVSTDTGLTNNNNSYSLEGAEYTVYGKNSNGTLSDSKGKLTTKADGSTNKSIDLVPGTYYAKETKASPGFQLDPTIYTLKVEAGKTASFTSKEVPLVSVYVKKNWNDDDNKFNTRPSSIKLELWSGTTNDVNKMTTKVQEITLSSANNWETTISNLPDTDSSGTKLYYGIWEPNAATYYTPAYSASTVNSSNNGYIITLDNNMQKGYLKVLKKSDDSAFTSSNSNYSLEGAVYTVYTDQNCTTKATYSGELKTDNSGATGTVEILPGTYYVKETTAPKGFELDPQVYTVTVTDGQTITVNSTDRPLISVKVTKQWNDDANKFSVRPSSIKLELWSGTTNDVNKMDTKVQDVTLTASNNWTMTISSLPETDSKGNKLYYGFWETTDNTPKFYTPAYSAGELNTSKNGYEVTVVNDLQKGFLKLQKTSLKSDLTDGNANYSLKDAVYTVYTDKTCSVKATYFGELRTDEKGATGTIEILPGTYYVKEMMLSRLVDTFFSRTSWTMLLYVENHSISVA